MRISKTTTNAIRILIDCAEAGGRLVKGAEIAERLGISPMNVFKIVHILSRAGFVEPVRGRHGGVRLSRSPEQIRVGDVVRAIEETNVSVATVASDGGRDDARPRLRSIFDDAMNAFIFVLHQHSLADLAGGAGPELGIASSAARKGGMVDGRAIGAEPVR